MQALVKLLVFFTQKVNCIIVYCSGKVMILLHHTLKPYKSKNKDFQRVSDLFLEAHVPAFVFVCSWIFPKCSERPRLKKKFPMLSRNPGSSSGTSKN